MTQKKREPVASRPEPRGYFLASDEGSGLLSWESAVARLVEARNYWIATASADGAPHAMPVWGVWLDHCLFFSTSPHSRKARNIARNPRVVVHLESGAQLVVVEGTATEVSDPVAIAAFVEAYNPKYGWDFTAEQLGSGGLFRLQPRKAFAWLGDEGEAFSGTGTRWVFET